MLKNKKAWIAILEASIGLVILFTFIATALNQASQNTKETGFDFNFFLNEVENNEELRNNVANNNINEVNFSLNNSLSAYNKNYNLDVCITGLNEACSINIKDKDIMAMDFFVFKEGITKKLRIFLWKRD